MQSVICRVHLVNAEANRIFVMVSFSLLKHGQYQMEVKTSSLPVMKQLCIYHVQNENMMHEQQYIFLFVIF